MSGIKLVTIGYKDCTIGRLWAGDFQCFSLELAWKQNKRNISCYPKGIYKYTKRISPSRGTEVIELIDVEDRSNCQIHAGNYTSQIEGCTLVGDSILFLNNDRTPDVANSGATFKKLLDNTPYTGTIEVIRYGISG